MLDIDVVEDLIKRIGGKFKLTTLIQKRMVELHRTRTRALIPVDKEMQRDLQRIAIEEIRQGKIELAPREEVGYTIEEEKVLLESEKPPAAEGEEGTASGAEIYGSDIKKIKEQRIKELAQLLNPKK